MRYVHIIFLLATLSLCSCASTRTAPRFVQPTTAPIKAGISSARKSVSSAQSKAKQIAKTEIVLKDPALKLQVDSLQIDLDTALTALDTTEGARQQLETQLKQETDKANALARDYDNAASQITTLKISRHRWVKFFLGSTALLLVSLVWVFRKPIMLLASGI